MDIHKLMIQTAIRTLVGYSPRLHAIDTTTGKARYLRWQHTWWSGMYSIVLSKVCFLHKDYLADFFKVLHKYYCTIHTNHTIPYHTNHTNHSLHKYNIIKLRVLSHSVYGSLNIQYIYSTSSSVPYITTIYTWMSLLNS